MIVFKITIRFDALGTHPAFRCWGAKSCIC